jgi:hypothetical protein
VSDFVAHAVSRSGHAHRPLRGASHPSMTFLVQLRHVTPIDDNPAWVCG